jgi:histidinol-phosphate aminotransferase
VAQQAGIMALDDTEYLERCNREMRKAKHYLINEFCRLGFTLIPSNTNFFLVKVGSAAEFRAVLLKHGILVRDCSSFGLAEYVRIAARTMADCQKLIAVIQVMRSGRELKE